MEKLKRIVSDRKWKHSSEPLEVFEGRIRNMLMLLSSIMSQDKLSVEIKQEARKQYMVMLVSSYETYLRETFKEIVDINLVSIDDLKKLRNFREVKFSIGELDYIQKNKICMSELLAEYINFQNLDDVLSVFSLWGFIEVLDKHNSKEELITTKKEELKSSLDSGKFLIDFLKSLSSQKTLMDKDYMFSKIKTLLEVRHKIIHKNIDISISQDEILEITLAVYKFVTEVDKFVSILEEKKK